MTQDTRCHTSQQTTPYTTHHANPHPASCRVSHGIRHHTRCRTILKLGSIPATTSGIHTIPGAIPAYHTRLPYQLTIRFIYLVCDSAVVVQGCSLFRTHHDRVEAVLAQRRDILELGVSRANRLVHRDLRALLGAEKQVLREVEGERHLFVQCSRTISSSSSSFL